MLAWAGPIASGETDTDWLGNLRDHHMMGASPLDCMVRDLSGEPAKQKSEKEPSRWRGHTKALGQECVEEAREADQRWG